MLAPHTDDGEFGCGGAMARLARARRGRAPDRVLDRLALAAAEGFAPDTLVHEVRAAARELGLADDALTVHDFEVRTFPALRQEILELLIDVAREFEPETPC